MTTILFLAISMAVFAPYNPYRKETTDQVREMLLIEQEREQRIENLLKTLRIVESSERYHVCGGSGEYGAYQFMPGTWAIYSYMFFGELLDIKIPENQDKVARLKIQRFVNKGYSDVDIAALWNSGTKDNWETRIGVNSAGVAYSVPAYIEKFINILRQQT